MAALAPTAWRRAGLAAAGALWLLAAEALTGEALLFGTPDVVPGREAWEGSLSQAATDVVGPIASSPLTLVAGGLGRVRRRCCRCCSAAAGSPWTASARPIWAAGLMVALAAVGDLTAGTAVLEQARGAVAGALVGAVAAVAISQTAPPTEGWRTQPVTTA